ncbi:MAG: MoaD/ThiS family protein [Planctomycetes bacterium]|nr:MoaD/ThiS family protein [Planctomycetota bacterium]
MVSLMLPSYLFDLLPEDELQGSRSRRAIHLGCGSWQELAREMRERFPLLAQRVLTEADEVADGFAVVVNDEVLRWNGASVNLRSGDQVAIIAVMAGG